MVQGLESEGSSPFCFLSFTRASTSASVIQQTGQSRFSPGKNLFISRGDILVRKRRAHLQRYQKSVDLIRDECDGRLDDVREETSECECLAGIALDAESGSRSTGQVRLALEEPKIRPTGHETQPRENGGGVRPKKHTADRVEEQEEGREMLDAHFDQALEEGNGMFGDKLFEGNQEGGLDGDPTTYLGETDERQQE